MSDNPASPNSWVVATTPATFEQDVLQRSQQVPVILDFWAEWCQPCRILGPLLESLAREFQGRFVLVKADTEQLPEAAMEFRVQGIPAVFAVLGGEIVDGFVGVLPEPQLRAWVGRIVAVGDLQRARDLEASDPQESERIYQQLVEADSNRAEPVIGLARLALAQGRLPEARTLIDGLATRGYLEPEAEKVRAALELQEKGDVNLDELQQLADAQPENLLFRLEYAEALAARERFQEALECLLTIVERDKKELRDKARQLMVDIFRVLPDDSELTATYRRRLASLLY